MKLVFRTFLVAALLTAVQIASAQPAEKPKAFVFDEFGKIGHKELKERTLKFRKEIERRERKVETSARYFFFFYRAESEESTDGVEKAVRNTLSEGCTDCMGFGPRILFVKAGKKKERLVQFWISPNERSRRNRNK